MTVDEKLHSRESGRDEFDAHPIISMHATQSIREWWPIFGR